MDPTRSLFLLIASILTLAVSIHGLSASPWAPATWVVTLDIGGPIPKGYSSGLVQGSNEGDGGGGGISTRIVTKFPITVTSVDCRVASIDRVMGTGASMMTVEPQSEATYMTMQGQQRIQFSSGGWTLSPREKPKSSCLQLWMDLECDIVKNDLKLSKGTRIYLGTPCWRETEYDLAVRAMRPIHQRYSNAQLTLEKTLSHESGDRRLDGTDALDTLQAYGAMAQLVLERDLTRAEYQRALEDYPPPIKSNIRDVNNNGGLSLLLPEGPWPGSDEWLTLGPQEQNPIFICPPSKGIFGGTGVGDVRAIGTWTAEPVLSETEFIYSDDVDNVGDDYP